MITYSVNSVKHIPESWTFPAGEVGIRAHYDSNASKTSLVRIQCHLTSSDEVMKLLMLTDSLKRMYYNASIEVHIGYIPYGRQDRVCSEGVSLSVKVFADIINSQKYSQVFVYDPHSDVTPALLNNVQCITQCEIYKKLFSNKVNADVIIAPDIGAYKKAKEIFQSGDFHSMMVASKVRDPLTGYITDFHFDGDVEGKNCVVVDDIIDGGATFSLIGKALKGKAKCISLCATHGIFSKGVGELVTLYDHVYTTNSYWAGRIGLVDGVTYLPLF